MEMIQRGTSGINADRTRSGHPTGRPDPCEKAPANTVPELPAPAMPMPWLDAPPDTTVGSQRQRHCEGGAGENKAQPRSRAFVIAATPSVQAVRAHDDATAWPIMPAVLGDQSVCPKAHQ